MGRPIRFAINGFGRIGRAVARQWVEQQAEGRFDLVAINDIAPLETCAYLLEFDSVYGPMVGSIESSSDRLIVNGHAVRFSQKSDLAEVDLSDVPLLRVLHEAYGVLAGHMTTIHCYTGSQPTVDAPRGAALERNRAAALSMVPTSTSAAVLIDKILPDLAGRVKGCAVRVPTASVSAVDLTCQVAHPVEQEALIELLRQARPDILGMTDRPLVSSDLRARRESLVIAAPQVAVMGQDLLRIFGWYDNEWGFSARMFDVAAKIT